MLGCRVEDLTLKVMVDVLKYVDKAYVGESRGESTTADTREKKRKKSLQPHPLERRKRASDVEKQATGTRTVR